MIQVLLIAGFSFFNPSSPVDSLGVQTINGKVFVIHKVDEKETLYGISKRYGTTIDAILQYNPTADAGLEIGQILKVPYTPRTVQKTSNGIVHTVTEKETLYSISKLYNVTIDEIKQWNGLTSNSLAIGQQLTIKKTNTVSAQISMPAVNPDMKLQKGTHQVAAGETLYGISKQYSVSIENLRKWNNLGGNDLQTGQIIFVAPPEYSSAQVIQKGQDQQVEIRTEETRPTETKTDSSVQRTEPEVQAPVTEKTPATDTPPSTPPNTRTVTISESVKGSDEVVQSGLAELIEGTEANRKYLALHRTAPVGTILKVRNEMNNREVFVRVMGKLPDTAVNDKLIIKISKSAYDRLGAIDPRFRVEVTYYK